ncbi:unnamed protein product [Symbiodinium natans]|uniref:Bifunctional lysine-specific demethylase and histidyl-hydroxylase n=1 Tax=Symbiodinium natans TaxID=878477 RepID=A0A812N7I4_9DINO|nr:unnamed protein product [Symbiodinium natans]
MLAQLIRPLPVDTFFREVWEKEPRVFHAALAAHPAPLSWEVLDEVLLRTLAPGCPEEAELVVYKDLKPCEDYSSPTAAYLDGASIIVNHVDKLWRPVFDLCRALREFPSLYANCYVTPRASQAAPPHADDRDVLVFQLEGAKHWKIYGEPPVYLPYPSEQVGKNGLKVPRSLLDTEPVFEGALNVGDVLYVPRGLVHEAATQDEASLHLTVAVPTYDWTVSRVLCDALQAALDGPGGKEDQAMPGIFDKARLREILEHLDLNQAQAIFRAKNAHHNERQEEALKSAESCSIARLPVTSSTELCWHSGVGTVDGFEDVFFVAPDGTEFDLNRLLQMLPKGRPLRPADVCSHGQRAKRRRVAEVSQQRPKEELSPDLTGLALIQAAGEQATQPEFVALASRSPWIPQLRIFDPAPEEMSEWSTDGGEVEPTAESCDLVCGPSLPENANASTQHPGSVKTEHEHTKPAMKPTSQGRDADNRKSSAKPVMEQSHLEFLQFLPSNPASDDGGCECGTFPSETAPSGMSAHREKQSGVSASEAKQQTLGVTKRRTSRRTSPLRPGLVTEARQASGEVPSPPDAGRLRIRITPQHFSRLGTTFRHVQVNFSPVHFAIQAVDCAGYAWTACSNMMPRCLAVDRCRYKIDPNGKDVLVTLCTADEGRQAWKCLKRLELFLAYQTENQVGDSKNSFT